MNKTTSGEQGIGQTKPGMNRRSKIARSPQVALKYQAKLTRRWLRRTQQMLSYNLLFLRGVPVLFANSFPKSGTHLLTQVLQGFPQIGPAVDSGLPPIVLFDPLNGRQRSQAEVLHDLDILRPGDIAYGHLHADRGVVEHLCQPGYVTYFILRDPRDVVVSHVYYITEMETSHIHHRYYVEQLRDFDERLRTSITGIPDPDVPFPDIQQRFVPFLEWLEHSEVLALRYEDFLANHEPTLGLVFDHALHRGFPAAVKRDEALRILSKSIDPQRSPTFRSGKAGGWREKFSPENTRLFKDIAGDLLIRLGSEQNNDW